jgi:hypothetical protein
VSSERCSVSDRTQSFSRRFGPYIAVVLLAIPLAAHVGVGWYSRYMADDYCTAGTLVRLGFWDSQAFWYMTWSGRYSFTFIVTLAEAIGVGVARLLPGLAVAAWLVVLTLFFHRLGRSVMVHMAPLAALAVSAGIVLAVLDGTPNVYQSLYWQTGMLTYVFPLILLVGLGAWLLSRATSDTPVASTASCLAVGLFTLVAGGFSETVGVLQVALLGLALIAVLAAGGTRRKALVAWVASALVGACLAVLLMYVAPGTQIRRELVSDPVSVPELAVRLIQDGRIFLSRTVRKIPAGLGLAVVLPLGIALLWREADPSAGSVPRMGPRRLLIALLVLPFLVAGLMLVTMAPYEFAVSDYPDARVLVTSLFVLVAGLSAWGFLLGSVLGGMRGRFAASAAVAAGVVSLVLLLASVPPATTRALSRLPDVQQFAADWGSRDQALEAAAGRGVESTRAASLPHMGGLAEIGYDPEEWVNRCVAQAYGLKEVIAK